MATRLPTADSLNIQTGLRMGPLRDPFRLRAVLSPAVAAQIICSSRMQNALTELSCLCVPGNVSVSQHLRSKGRQRIEKIQKLSKFQLIGSLVTDQKNLLAVGRCNMHAGNSHRRVCSQGSLPTCVQDETASPPDSFRSQDHTSHHRRPR